MFLQKKQIEEQQQESQQTTVRRDVEDECCNDLTRAGSKVRHKVASKSPVFQQLKLVIAQNLMLGTTNKALDAMIAKTYLKKRMKKKTASKTR